MRVNGDGGAQRGARRPRDRRPSYVRRPTTSSTARKRRPVRGVRPDRAAVALRPLEARGRARHGRRPTRATSSSAPRGCSARAGATSSRRCSASRPSGEVRVVRRPGGLPDLHRAPGRGARAARRRRGATASTTSPARGSCSWFEFAREIFERAGRRDAGRALHHRRVPAPGAAARLLGARQRARRARRCPHWQEGLDAYLASGARVRLLVTGAAGFIGSTYVRAARAREHDVVVLDKLTYAGPAREPAGVERRSSCVGAIEDRDAGARAGARAATRS